MLTLVDNAFDVRMQDVDMEPGDKFDGFTKRLSAAYNEQNVNKYESFRVESNV